MKAEALYIKIDKTAKGGVMETHLFPSDADFACIKSYTNSRNREGGAPSISASFYFSRPLDKEWSREEYVEFDGERYYARSIPSSSKDSTSGLYKHEASFISKREVLDNTLFLMSYHRTLTTRTEETSTVPIKRNSRLVATLASLLVA